MGHPVYRLGAVLRRLRNDAGLTILGAAEATGYGKYERWESGQTQVGAKYLGTIAEAFGVTDDVHLLVYAWLLDRLSPQLGEPARQLDREALARCLQDAPDGTIDLRDDAELVIESGRQVDVALLALVARYGTSGTLVLRATERSALPSPRADTPTLVQLYGDALAGASAAIGRALLARGIDGDEQIDVTNIAPAMADPTTYERLAGALESIDVGAESPTGTFAVSTAPDARRFAELLPRLRAELRGLLAAADRPSIDDDAERLMHKVLSGETLPVLRLLVRAGRRGQLPAVDPALTAELREMRDRLGNGWRDAVAQETVIELREASTADAVDALEAFRRRRSA